MHVDPLDYQISQNQGKWIEKEVALFEVFGRSHGGYSYAVYLSTTEILAVCCAKLHHTSW